MGILVMLSMLAMLMVTFLKMRDRRAAPVLLLLVLAMPAQAQRTVVPRTNAPGGYVTALTALTLTAADTTNGNYIQLTGDDNDLLIIQNTDSSSATVTVHSVADPISGRSGSITSESIPAGALRIFGPPKLRGWAQAGARLHVDTGTTLVKYAHVPIQN